MRAFVDKEEIKEVKENLESTPIIVDVLGDNWINNNLLNREERIKKHTLFWLFLDATKIQKMENWLIVTKACVTGTKFNKIVNSLKAKRDEKDCYSLLAELEVLAYYGSKGIKVEYEPDIPEKKNVGDLKLTIGSVEVFVEITRLFESQEDERTTKLVRSVAQKIDEIPDNPFISTLVIEDGFCEKDLEPFIELVSNEIAKNKNTLEPAEGKPYIIDFYHKAELRLRKKISHKKGYVGGSIYPTVEICSAGRLKNKILDKLEQLPDGKLNAVAVDISYHFADFGHVKQAFDGQLGYLINRKTGEGTYIRHANGVVHIDEGRQIGVLIAFKSFNYEQRRKYPNLSATVPFTDEFLSMM